MNKVIPRTGVAYLWQWKRGSVSESTQLPVRAMWTPGN